MADAKSTQPAAPEGFTEREQRLMLFVLLHSDITSLQIDYPAVAGRMGLTNVRSASNAWGALKKKILAIDAKDKAANPEKAAAVEESTTPKTPSNLKTPAKGKRSAAAMVEGDADADAAETPTPIKKARGRKPKVTATPRAEDVKAEGGEGAPIDLVTATPKKPLRGRAAAKAAAEKAAAIANEEDDDSEPEAKKKTSNEDVTMTDAKFAPIKGGDDDEDVEELINPADVTELEEIAAAGVKAIKEEQGDNGSI